MPTRRSPLPQSVRRPRALSKSAKYSPGILIFWAQETVCNFNLSAFSMPVTNSWRLHAKITIPVGMGPRGAAQHLMRRGRTQNCTRIARILLLIHRRQQTHRRMQKPWVLININIRFYYKNSHHAGGGGGGPHTGPQAPARPAPNAGAHHTPRPRPNPETESPTSQIPPPPPHGKFEIVES